MVGFWSIYGIHWSLLSPTPPISHSYQSCWIWTELNYLSYQNPSSILHFLALLLISFTEQNSSNAPFSLESFLIEFWSIAMVTMFPLGSVEAMNCCFCLSSDFNILYSMPLRSSLQLTHLQNSLELDSWNASKALSRVISEYRFFMWLALSIRLLASAYRV